MIVQSPEQWLVPLSNVDVALSIEIDCAKTGLVSDPNIVTRQLPICQTVWSEELFMEGGD